MTSSRTLRRAGVLFASLALLVSLAAPVGAAGGAASRFTATALKPIGRILGDFSKAAQKDGKIAVIVALADAPVASYEGGLKGLPATSPATRHAKSIDFKSQATRDYQGYLKTQRDRFAANVANEVKSAKLGQSFDVAFNGFAARVPKDDLAALAAVPGVAAIYPDVILKPDTDRSPQFIGAPTVWTSLGGQESSGEGVIVGVLDTGIWPEHPSFSDPDPSGKAYAAPPAPPSGVRSCQFSGGVHPGPAFTCNNKLIGAMRKMATYDAVIGLTPGEFTTARDDDGHGSHTSSTAAGNAGVTASIFGVNRGIISGIAPRAYVEMFKVCGASGCFGSDSVSAVNEALLDGVNVINFSISGGANAFSDAVEVAFRGAYDAGVFVAASAGNSGPGPDTTDHRGPWVTTVAASTADRAFVDQVQVTADGGASLTLNGISLTAGVGPLPLIVATGDGLCGAGTGPYSGEIVICKRGTQGRAEKGLNVFNAGGAGMVLYNQSAAVTDLETDNHYLPASHIQFSQGQTLLTFAAGHTNVMATITAGVKGNQQGDVMASFSSRGGPGQTLGVSKPDITAPGVQILAAASPDHIGVAGAQGQLFQAIAGTSMSSPHIAGSGALLKALHPTWTPGQIKSALMTTAKTAGVVKEDGTTPANAYDDGSGRVDLTVAGDPGIAFASTGPQFVAAQSHLWDANYPSVFVPSMPGMIDVNRTAQNLTGSSQIWQLKATGAADFTISVPNKITIGPGGSATFTIGLDASLVPQGQTRFGVVTLKQSKGGNRTLHMPVTIVRGQGAVTLNKACAPTTLTPGAVTHCDLTIANPTFNAATYSLKDKLPPQLKLVASSVANGTVSGNDTVLASGNIAGATPPDVAIAPGSSPAGGYLALSLFGIPPIAGTDDDTVTNFNVPAFSFGGETWTRVGVSSNGYLIVGGGAGSADNQFLNQNLPSPTRPNNVLALFWSDLNPGAAGAIRIGTLTDGSDTWIVADWEAVREFSTAGNTHSMQVWIGVNGDANPGEDVSYAYGPNTGAGDGNLATVGAENRFGNRGGNIYYNGTGTLPTNGTQLRVTTTPGTSSSIVVSFDAKAGDPASWTNCASLTSNAFLGTAVSCVSGVTN